MDKTIGHFPRFSLRTLVIQPTSFCNIACRYCYLSSRHNVRRMSPDLCERLASSLAQAEHVIDLVWHCGEPLACGVECLETLFAPFEPLRRRGSIQHSIQTNGTLISGEWCDFFKKYEVAVSISIDGPSSMNLDRVDRRNRDTTERCLEGIAKLKRHGISFNTISVITKRSVRHAEQLLDFLIELGTASAAFNVLEVDGAATIEQLSDVEVEDFWADLYLAWRKKPRVMIREFRHALGFLKFAAGDKFLDLPNRDWLMSVDVAGNVRVLSPEFIDTKSEIYANFILGNIATSSLAEVLAAAENSSYVLDYLDGVDDCAKNCEYYAFCRGGSASNKISETGSIGATETTYCRQAKKLLMEAVLSRLEEGMAA